MANYQEDEIYDQYLKSGSKKDRTRLVMALHPILQKKFKALAGSLPDSALKAEIAKHAASAIDSYDPSKGAKLSTHVFNHIAQASRLNYTYQNVVRMSEAKQQGQFKYYKKAYDDLSSELLKEPTPAELALRLGWKEKEVTDFQSNLYQDVHEGNLEYLGAASEYSDDATRMNHVRSSLTDEERSLLDSRFKGLSQEEMSSVHGMDVNKLNYSHRKLVNKVRGLLEEYDGYSRPE